MTIFEAISIMISFSTMIITLIAVIVAIFSATKK
ncbi:putative holin-like toxin [Halobacillus karajensis]|nr:putative holin-like toxin [Halobacillus karajensis]